MEFFLQTLVKKKRLSQSNMLFLQQVLMIASTVAAIGVLVQVNMIVSMSSLVLNFVNRKHDLINTGLLLILCIAGSQFQSQ
jgi:hypothetical protein